MKRLLGAVVVLAVFFLGSSNPASAQSEKKSAKKAESKPAAQASDSKAEAKPADAEKKEDAPLKALNWRLVGPYRGGRVLAVTGVLSEPNTYYFGGVGGGVWKTVDGGMNWMPLTDKESFSSVGAIAVADSDPNVIYVGTGESCWRGNILEGEGVYKSTDAGKTWRFIGLKDTRHIARVIVNPKNPDIVFIAAMGHAFGPNTERGVFRSMDGGKSWEKVLYKDDKTGAVDITFDPSNPSILFAALYEAKRLPWDSISGGPGSGLYRSADGGTTWKKVEGNGLPGGIWGKVGVTVSGANPNRVWAQIEAEKGGLYRSDDGGQKWTLINDSRNFQQRAWYYTHIFADPKNEDGIYELNVQISKSTDGGRTFRTLQAPHGDNHGFWIDRNNPDRMINGNDGGATISTNGGATWTSLDNQPTAQFYHVTTDNFFPYRIYGAQQDNTSVSIASRTNGFGIGVRDWWPVGGCESGYIAPHPTDPNITYAGCYGGHITRYDHRTDDGAEVNAWPYNPLGAGAADLKYRWQWTAPIVISPFDPEVLYHGANKLLKSTDRGQSWTEISPDLTRNDKSKQGPAGGPITKDNTSVEYYDTIFAMAESPVQKDLLWVGSDDGLIHVSKNGGKDWENITPKDLPEWSRISLIEPSHFDAGTAYVAVDRHELEDNAPYILKTTDFGKSWTRIQSDLPADAFVRAVREDWKKKGLLFAGTERGVFFSNDDGAHWKSLQNNLPMSSMRDLAIHGDDLIVATHGRSFWALDDFSPLREMGDEVAKEDAHLFQVSDAYRFFGAPGGRGNTGQNPPNGAIIQYWLKESLKKAEKKDDKAEMKHSDAPAESKTKLEILDGAGKVVRTYPEKPQPGMVPPGEGEGRGPGPRPQGLGESAGLNRFVWDLRYEPVERVPNSVLWGGGVDGPVAVPGTYTARLTVNGKSYESKFAVKADPRVKATADDWQKMFDLRLRVQQKLGLAHQTVNQIRDVRKQIQELDKKLEAAKDPRAKEVKEAGAAIDKKMTAVEEELLQTKSKSSQDPLNYPLKLNNLLAALGGEIDDDSGAPTRQQGEVFEMLAAQADAQVAKWTAIKESDLKAFNQMVREKEVPAVLVK